MSTPDEEKIFRVATEIESEHLRALYLNQVCGDNTTLRARMQNLLIADQEDCSLLDSGVHAETRDSSQLPNCELPQIPGYSILEKIGEGGMGIVYLAEQLQPVHRKVALKILRTSLLDEQAMKRFEAERHCMASLHHPNIAAVYTAGSIANAQPFVVMELVDGIPITQYCDDHQLSLDERLQLFQQVCQGVQHAHYRGIIHRDLKPSNILITEYNHHPVPKLIDFGVAKSHLTDAPLENPITQANQIIGTLGYMSPEQASANQSDIDTRSDIYSLGTVLHELVCGDIPLSAEFSAAETLEDHLTITRESIPSDLSRSIQLSDNLQRLAEDRQTTPAELAQCTGYELNWIVAKCLEKEPDSRYPTAKSLSDDIERFRNDLPIEARPPSLIRKTSLFINRHRYQVYTSIISLVLFLVVSLTSIVVYRESRQRRRQELQLALTSTELEKTREQAKELKEAREIIAPQLLQLMNDQQSVAAYQMIQSLGPSIKSDSLFEDIMSDLMLTTSFDQLPNGTTVRIRDATSEQGQWLTLGMTPLIDIPIPKGPIRIRFEKTGYVTRELQLKVPQAFKTSACRYLVRNQDQQQDMVWICGKEKQQDMILNEFWIDKLEVSNEQFQTFVDAGGYQNAALWDGLIFQQDGKTLGWAQAVKSFVDQTGQPGPALWQNGHYPKGQGKYPVGGVSWFEANAYARFCSKDLPTLHHWKWAADSDQPGIMAAAGNFLSAGPKACGIMTGVGRFDALDLAGNVREWCRTADDHGHQYALGGDWTSPYYSFNESFSTSPWDRSPQNGFRCVRYPDGLEPGGNILASVAKPKSLDLGPEREPFARLQAMYLYDHDLPLGRTIKSSNTQTGINRKFRHDVVEINAAYNSERFKVHLLVPEQAQGNMETIIFVPGVSAWENGRELKVEKEPHVSLLKRLANSGRIVCFPVYQGTYERWSGNTIGQQFQSTPIRARDDYIAVTKDGSRVVDYLLTREDVDPKRIVYFGLSNGALRGPMALATDTRYRAAVLLSGGYTKWHKNRPEIQAFHFTPEVKQPVLMMNGTSDQVFPVETSQKPMFNDLGSANKKHVLFSAHHIISAHEVFKTMTQWLETEAYSTK